MKHKKFELGISSFLRALRFWKNAPDDKPAQIHAKRRSSLPVEKQEELDALCRQLFRKKELITSGKLQFIGLAKIKRRLGRGWAGLSKIVYDTAEDVIEKHLELGDVFIRYQDDTYVMIFARASLEEGNEKAARIAEEITRRLFELDEEELRDLEIRRAMSEIRTNTFSDLDFTGMMDVVFEDIPTIPEADEEDSCMPEINAIEVDTVHRRKQQAAEDKNEPVKLHYSYLPLWDTRRGALTTYLCLIHDAKTKKDVFSSHAELYASKDIDKKLFYDQKTLEIVSHELEEMERDGRKFFIVCPLQHETIYNFERYEVYKEQLSKIPLARRQYLILLVENMAEALTKDPYWFAAPLRQFCRHVFAEIPLRRDINFNYLRNSGIDTAGVRLDSGLGTEQQVIALLNSFSAKAKALKINQTFVLGVSSLSLTTSAVCAGYHYIGGPAIHDTVTKPDSIHRYQNEDLLSALMKV